jgi:hypothetical protein
MLTLAMNHPGMTSRGKSFAAIFGILLALSLPKSVECGFPGGYCAVYGGPNNKMVCKYEELEPLGLYLIERVAHRNVGFAYSKTTECR